MSENAGKLEKPEFGVLPVRASGNYVPRPFDYEDLLDMVRERPGEDAKIAVFKQRGTDVSRKQTLRAVQSARSQVWIWLLRNKPYEAWSVGTRTTPETWGDRELWVTYLGEMDQEELDKVKEIRYKAYSKRSNRDERVKGRSILREWEKRRRQMLVE